MRNIGPTPNYRAKNIIEDIDISISHCKEYAVANVVIIERED